MRYNQKVFPKRISILLVIIQSSNMQQSLLSKDLLRVLKKIKQINFILYERKLKNENKNKRDYKKSSVIKVFTETKILNNAQERAKLS